MKKAILRDQFRQQRSALPEKERLRRDDLLLIQFQRLQIPDHATVLLSYWPLLQHAEINTLLMVDFLQFRVPGLQVAYPVADFSTHTMKSMLAQDATDFKKNAYGIAEPVNGTVLAAEAVDIIFVPLLVFDINGHRIGYGKGFYDRFLSTCREDSLKIGFSYFEPVEGIDDIGQFDVPLTTGVTPGDMYEF
ncbi:MAG: 5-formyltetrahydrofolate cyclo-ligase [Bacteroidota bacterium]